MILRGKSRDCVESQTSPSERGSRLRTEIAVPNLKLCIYFGCPAEHVWKTRLPSSSRTLHVAFNKTLRVSKACGASKAGQVFQPLRAKPTGAGGPV